MRFIGVRTWKTGIGAVIAMIIAKEWYNKIRTQLRIRCA